MRSDLGTIRGLKERCRRFRAHLGEHGGGLVADAELRAAWPGGAENRETGLAGWIYCYGTYRAMLARLDRAETDADDGTVSVAAAKARLDAARAQPVTVELVDPDSDGNPQYRSVYPKSLDALLQMEAIDRWLRECVEQMERHTQALLTPERGDQLTMLYEEIGYQHRLLLTIACHPGPETPLTTLVGRVTPADWTAALTPTDVTNLLMAHREVNGRRVIEARRAFLPTPGGKPVSWETLVATVAKQRGEPTPHLMRHQDLASIIVELSLTTATSPTEED